MKTKRFLQFHRGCVLTRWYTNRTDLLLPQTLVVTLLFSGCPSSSSSPISHMLQSPTASNLTPNNMGSGRPSQPPCLSLKTSTLTLHCHSLQFIFLHSMYHLPMYHKTHSFCLLSIPLGPSPTRRKVHNIRMFVLFTTVSRSP